MEIRNIERAKELIPQLETLGMAKSLLASQQSQITVTSVDGQVTLPQSLTYNVLHVVNCEYERIRKEVKEL